MTDYTLVFRIMINVSDKAKDQISVLRATEGYSEAHNLRVSVKGGGCSGLMYDIAFDDTVTDAR